MLSNDARRCGRLTLAAEVIGEFDLYLVFLPAQELLKDVGDSFSLGRWTGLAIFTASHAFIAPLHDGRVRQVDGAWIVLVVFIFCSITNLNMIKLRLNEWRNNCLYPNRRDVFGVNCNSTFSTLGPNSVERKRPLCYWCWKQSMDWW